MKDAAKKGAFGRMAFGSVVMLAFLAATGRLDTLAGLGLTDIGWVLATSALLFGYVTGYYSGLKHAPATMVSSILVLGAVITSGLYAVIDARRFTAAEVAGLALTALAVATWIGAARLTRARARVAEAIRAGR